MSSDCTYLTSADAAYPPRLRAAGAMPAVYVRRHATSTAPAARGAVAVVGARAASQPAMLRAHALGRHLAERGVHVVSGGALGIDGAAHRGALAGGGTTTVVLGCGVDVAYPDRHAPLFAEVVATGGALVSLVAPDMPPRPRQFAARNTVIAALAEVVVVVEAQLRSGSLSTANRGRALGRIVAAYPGSPGCDRLLADPDNAAALVEHPDDVIAALGGTVRHRQPPALDPATAAVAAARATGACTVDDLVTTTGLPARAVLRALSILELAGGPRG